MTALSVCGVPSLQLAAPKSHIPTMGAHPVRPVRQWHGDREHSSVGSDSPTSAPSPSCHLAAAPQHQKLCEGRAPVRAWGWGCHQSAATAVPVPYLA